MALWITVPDVDTKLDDPSLIPGTLMVEEK